MSGATPSPSPSLPPNPFSTPTPFAPQIDIDALLRQGRADGASAIDSGSGTVLRPGKRIKQIPIPYTSMEAYEKAMKEMAAQKGERPPSFGGPVSLSDFNGEFVSKWQDPKFKSWFISRAVAAGLLDPDQISISEAHKAWMKIGQSAASLGSAWADKTPEQLLEFYATGETQQTEALDGQINDGTWSDVELLGGPLDSEPQPTTSVSTAYSVVDPATARAITRSVLDGILGREPTEDEYDSYVQALTLMSQSRPTVTTTTTDGEGNTSSTTQQGVSQQDLQQSMVEDVATSAEGRATSVDNVFRQALDLLAQGR